jgi:hypothetical protein
LSCASASSSSFASLSTAPARVCAREPPSASLSGDSPIAAATTGGPATNSCDVPRTITEKCEATTRAAPSPATGPSAAATTGTRARLAIASSMPGMKGTYV